MRTDSSNPASRVPPDPSAGRGGDLPRRATADPDRFLIPADQLPPGFAEQLDAPGGAPAAPRPAATIVLLRQAPGGGGPEALLLRRHRQSGFAAGAWVFPGGTVDAADRDPALPVLCDGASAEEWARRLGLDDPAEAFGYVAAALREAFEETGILLARAGVGGDDERNAEAARHAVAEHRDALLEGQTSLREIAAAHGLRYATDQFVYVAHWITPEPEPRRYDTRFFLSPLIGGQACIVHEPELVEARWLAPADAVEGFQAGELKMLPPTVHTLRRLAGFRTLADLLSALRDEPVPTILPRMSRQPDGVEIRVEK